MTPLTRLRGFVGRFRQRKHSVHSFHSFNMKSRRDEKRVKRTKVYASCEYNVERIFLMVACLRHVD